jgi:hypothetical protein
VSASVWRICSRIAIRDRSYRLSKSLSDRHFCLSLLASADQVERGRVAQTTNPESFQFNRSKKTRTLKTKL